MIATYGVQKTADDGQPGLLAAWDTGAYLTGPGYLYSSDDHGASRQAVTNLKSGTPVFR